MAGTRGSKRGGSEYVTDWRAVYAVVGVFAFMVLGGLAWTLFAPAGATPIAYVNTAVADTSPVVSARVPASPTEAIEVAVPWAPLTQVRHLQPDTTRSSRPGETSAKPDFENATRLASDEAANETPTIAKLEEPTRPYTLFDELARAITLDFNPVKKTPTRTRVDSRTASAGSSGPLTLEQQFAKLANQSDLVGLPILGEDQCHKSSEEVKELARWSRQMASINRSRAIQETNSFSLSQELDLAEEFSRLIDVSTLHSTSVAPLVQILQVQSVPIRAKLVYALSGIDGPEASRALADRAMFDLSPDIRAAAIESLKRRSRQEYQPRLLSAFRYPWAAVAFHATEALVTVGDTDALPRLKKLLDEPDPSLPFVAADGTWQKTELVRVNHLRNCLLCHPRAGLRSDQIRAAVPTPGRPLPRTYYQSFSGDAVRADVTYLRQDFSVMQPVIDHGPWPDMQRFDFLVRTRPLTEEETRDQSNSTSADPNAPSSYPQREAVLLAIKGLSESGT